MLKIGIDALSFYTPSYFLDLKTLAHARGVDYNKFYVGLGQHQMSIVPPDEDIVTMAANAAIRALRDIDYQTIDTVLFATESSIDQSKAAGVFVHYLLGLPEACRILELKQACYSATGAIQLVAPKLIQNPDKKVLLVASDVSRYGLNTAGESSQGAGAVAMVLSANPRILALEPGSGLHTEDVMDFWRPNYLDEAIVEGKYSSKLYLNSLEKTWQRYQANTQRQFNDHQRFCYHNSVPRLVEKAHALLTRHNQLELSNDIINTHIQDGLLYGRKIGNSYTASLYVSLASLLDNCKTDLSNRRIGFYSYGSGCVAEYFSGIVQPEYKHAIDKIHHQQLLNNRHELTQPEYEKFYAFEYPRDGRQFTIPKYEGGHFRLAQINKHKRIYDIQHLNKKSAETTRYQTIAS